VSHRAGSNVTLLDLGGRRLVLASASPRRPNCSARSGSSSTSCPPTSTNRFARRGAVGLRRAAVAREGRCGRRARSTAQRSSSLPTRRSTSTAGSSRSPSTTTTHARCCVFSPDATHLVHTGVTACPLGSGPKGQGCHDRGGGDGGAVRRADRVGRSTGTSRRASTSARPVPTASRAPLRPSSSGSTEA
jgi:hypothetical protein